MIRSWGELLQEELRVDIEDTRAEMVRVSVIAYLGCVVTGVLSVSVAQSGTTSIAAAVTVIVVAALTAAALWMFGRRLPLWILILQAPYAALLLAVGLWAGGVASASMFPLFYVLVVLYGTFFLRAGAAAALIVFCSLTFAMVVSSTGDPDWPTRVASVFGVSVTVGLFAGLLVKRVHERSVLDPLTGLLNRRMWEFLVRQEVNKAARTFLPFSVLLIDLDDFKAVNDEFGHLHGDRVLKQVAEILRRVLRATDAACRWGGDEFAVLLVNCDTDQLRLVEERLQVELDEVLAFSSGTATWRIGMSATELFQEADESLYAAKAARAP